MKLFKRTLQIPTIQPTAADVHLMLMAFSMAYMDEIVQSVSPKLENKAKLLESLGFINTAEIRQKESEESRYDEYKTLCEYKEMFPDSIFLKVDDFKKVLEKYGLVAGLASQYTGTIPDDCLELIHKARIAHDNNHNIINCNYKIIKTINAFALTLEEKDKIIKDLMSKFGQFPFVKESHSNMTTSYINSNTFLIAATPDKMKDTVTVVTSLIKADPIVFQLLPYDIVVVHAKWGDEADDEAFTNKIL